MRRKTPLRARVKRGRSFDERNRWWAIRWERFELAGGRCEAFGLHSRHCTGSVAFRLGECHHVVPTQHGGRDEIGNTLWLHPDCHRDIHSNPAKATHLGLLSRGGQ